MCVCGGVIPRDFFLSKMLFDATDALNNKKDGVVFFFFCLSFCATPVEVRRAAPRVVHLGDFFFFFFLPPHLLFETFSYSVSAPD